MIRGEKKEKKKKNRKKGKNIKTKTKSKTQLKSWLILSQIRLYIRVHTAPLKKEIN